MGRLIPAGTGVSKYRGVKLMIEEPEDDEPGADGYPTARAGAGRDEVLVGRIRRQPWGREVRIVALTGWAVALQGKEAEVRASVASAFCTVSSAADSAPLNVAGSVEMLDAGCWFGSASPPSDGWNAAPPDCAIVTSDPMIFVTASMRHLPVEP